MYLRSATKIFRLPIVHAQNSLWSSLPPANRTIVFNLRHNSTAALPTSNEPILSLTFTCTAPGCDRHRSSHTFSKRSYEHGVVLIECPGCHNRHLIADHLGWFADATEQGKHKTLEEIMRARGVEVTRGTIREGGAIEFNEEDVNKGQGS